MEQVLHLFITNKCRHNCPLCCNKFYKIDEIPVVTVELLKSVETVCLTGGEPFSIESSHLAKLIVNLRTQFPNIKNLYIYTSGYESIKLIDVLGELKVNSTLINGINFAPKDFMDAVNIKRVIEDLHGFFRRDRSCRLYVFKEVKQMIESMISSLQGVELVDYNVHSPLAHLVYIKVIDRQWTSTFNTSENEHFARLPILF